MATLEDEQKATERIIKEIEESAACKQYFAPYQEERVKNFIQTFAEYKAKLEIHGEQVENYQGSAMKLWRDQCWYCLNEIQHKKLFDLQCLWRAEEVKDLLRVECTQDFVEIGNTILDYKGIPDITRDELDTYLEFLHHPQGRRQYYYGNKWHNLRVFQDYRDVKSLLEKGDSGEVDYYEFHNTRFGGERLLKLPDIRGEKEMDYAQIAMKHRAKKYEDEQKAKGEAEDDKSPEKEFLWSSEEELVRFAKFMNDRPLTRYLKALHIRSKSIDDPELDWAILYIQDNYPDSIDTPANKDWRQATVNAASIHLTDKVIKWLPAVYDEYLMKKEMSIPIVQEPASSFKGFDIRELILEGRVLKGEPKNFDF